MRYQIVFLLFISPILFYPQKTDTIRGTKNNSTYSLPFTLLHIQNNQDSKKIPIVLFLHGAGERGLDNTTQLSVGLPTLVNTINITKKSCLLIVPQCPLEDKWVNTDWTKSSHEMSSSMTLPLSITLQLLDSIKKTYPNIDTNKIYLTGISMGGFATWELLQRYPNKFTAAIPICGGGDTSLANRIKKCPVWAFHGKKDKLVKVTRTTDMYKAIRKFNQLSKITILQNEGHLCWNSVYKREDVVNWLFSKIKNY